MLIEDFFFGQTELNNGLDEPGETYDDGRHAERFLMEAPSPRGVKSKCVCPLEQELMSDQK